MKELETIHQRNILLFRLMILGLTLDLIANIFWHESWVFLGIIGVSELFIITTMGYFIRKKIGIRQVMYYLMTLIWLLVTLINVIEGDLVNISFYFLLPIAASSLFPSVILSIYMTFLSGTSFVYFSLLYGTEVMGEHFIPSDLWYYGVLFVLIGSIGTFQQMFSEKLRKNVDNHATRVSTMNNELSHIVENMTTNGAALNDFSKKLEVTVGGTADKTDVVSQGFYEMNMAINEQTQAIAGLLTHVQSVSEQTEHINETSEEMEKTASQSSGTIEQTNRSVTQLQKDMKQLHGTFHESLTINLELQKETNEIETIISALGDITNQIQLLSLNAAIEAARSGEHGKGFAVVADEIRKLSDKTKKSTKEIGHILSSIQEKTIKSVEKMKHSQQTVFLSQQSSQKVQEVFKILTVNNKQVVDEIAEITEMIEGLRTSISSIHHTISRISSASEQNGRSVHLLSTHMFEMDTMIKQINLEFIELQKKTQFLE